MTAEQIKFAQESLLQGAARGDVLRMKSALVAGAVLDGQRPGMGDTALLLATAMGHELAVAFLLDEAGANPDIQNAVGRTALHEAAFLKTPAIWNCLIQAGARTDIVSVDRHTPLTLKDSLSYGASMVAYSQKLVQQAMGQRSGERDNSRGR